MGREEACLLSCFLQSAVGGSESNNRIRRCQVPTPEYRLPSVDLVSGGGALGGALFSGLAVSGRKRQRGWGYGRRRCTIFPIVCSIPTIKETIAEGKGSRSNRRKYTTMCRQCEPLSARTHYHTRSNTIGGARYHKYTYSLFPLTCSVLTNRDSLQSWKLAPALPLTFSDGICMNGTY